MGKTRKPLNTPKTKKINKNMISTPINPMARLKNNPSYRYLNISNFNKINNLLKKNNGIKKNKTKNPTTRNVDQIFSEYIPSFDTSLSYLPNLKVQEINGKQYLDPSQLTPDQLVELKNKIYTNIHKMSYTNNNYTKKTREFDSFFEKLTTPPTTNKKVPLYRVLDIAGIQLSNRIKNYINKNITFTKNNLTGNRSLTPESKKLINFLIEKFKRDNEINQKYASEYGKTNIEFNSKKLSDLIEKMTNKSEVSETEA